MNVSKLTLLLLCILLISTPQSIFAARIVLDAGHGGSDPGAIGVNGLKEKDVNLDITKKVQIELVNMGYEIIMTRTTDKFLTLQERVKLTNATHPDLFVSIHANAHPQSHVQGSMVLYYDQRYPQKRYPASKEMIQLSPQSKALAQSVQKQLVQSAGTTDKGLLPSSAYVIRMGKVPSILVETAFLSNWQDAERLADEQLRSTMAKGIVKGITQYMPISFQDTVSHWAKLSILKMKDTGIMVGYGDVFRPNKAITRAELLATLDRVFYFTQLEPIDVEPDQPEDASPEQEAAEELGEIDQENSASIDDSGSEHMDPTEDAEQTEQHEHPEPLDHDTGNETEATNHGTDQVQISSTQNIEASTEAKQISTDIDESHWAYDIFEKAIQLGIIEGYPDGTIQPNKPVTRAEASVLFDRIHSLTTSEEDPGVTIATPFVDVPEASWASASIYRMKSSHLIHGITDTTFAPKKKMTRAEISVIIDRYID